MNEKLCISYHSLANSHDRWNIKSLNIVDDENEMSDDRKHLLKKKSTMDAISRTTSLGQMDSRSRTKHLSMWVSFVRSKTTLSLWVSFTCSTMDLRLWASLVRSEVDIEGKRSVNSIDGKGGHDIYDRRVREEMSKEMKKICDGWCWRARKRGIIVES